MRYRKPLIEIILTLVVALIIVSYAGCDIISDPAIRLDDAIDSSVARLGNDEGDMLTIRYQPDIDKTGSYRVQFDKVGALIVWYDDAKGKVIDSGSTSHIARYVDIPRTLIIDKPADSALFIVLQRRHGRAIISGVK